MRLVVPLLAALVFAAMLIFDPVALGQLGYACATGHCGVRPRTLGLGLAILVAVMLGMKAIRVLRRPKPPPIPVRKPRARNPTPRKPRKKADA